MDFKEIAQKVFQIEGEELNRVSKNINEDFDRAINAILLSSGRLVISGMGKSGIVGRKISATLSSTGTSSFFIHPSEAYHGDLGMIKEEDIVILISNSGETDEILKLLPFLKEQGNLLISMCGNISSNLVKNSNFHIDIGVSKEACPLQLAPTSSTTATIVMGDAIAIALMESRGFKDENFAKFHPGGSLGRKLLLKVENVMQRENLPVISPTATTKEIINKITKGKAGLVAVVDKGNIKGVITDGDIRRTMESRENEFFLLNASQLMSENPKKVFSNERLIDVSNKMTNEKINTLLVTDINEKLVGIVQLFDIGV